MAVTLEREALERALVSEQAEVRLLQQELSMAGAVADALEEAQAQLEEARLAIAAQQEQAQEQGEQLAEERERAARLGDELERVRAWPCRALALVGLCVLGGV